MPSNERQSQLNHTILFYVSLYIQKNIYKVASSPQGRPSPSLLSLQLAKSLLLCYLHLLQIHPEKIKFLYTDTYCSVLLMARAGRSKAASTISYVSMPANFSGPLVSIIPKDVHHKKRSNGKRGVKPTSPKISCMGQIKSKKKKKEVSGEKEMERPRRRLFSACFESLFRRRVRPGGGEAPEKEVEEKMRKKSLPAVAVASVAAPRLGQMRQYQSGRETLRGFDWRKAMEENYGEGEEEEEDDEVFIPHSAPILVGGGAVAMEPKKEVNLWRRRDMPPPLPLQIERN